MNFKDYKKLLKEDLSGLPAVKLSLVGDSATQFLSTAIRGAGASRGFNIDLFEAEYNQVERQFLDPSSELYRFDAEFVVVFQSTHKLGWTFSMMAPERRQQLADERLDFISSICSNPSLAGRKIICFNYPEIDDTVFGSYANKVESSLTWQVRKLNYGLMSLSQQFPNLYICDIAAVQNKIGRDAMFAANIYTSTEMVLSIDSLPLVADRVMDIVCAVKGHFKKCLILDLDNTVWGGVIGDRVPGVGEETETARHHHLRRIEKQRGSRQGTFREAS